MFGVRITHGIPAADAMGSAMWLDLSNKLFWKQTHTHHTHMHTPHTHAHTTHTHHTHMHTHAHTCTQTHHTHTPHTTHTTHTHHTHHTHTPHTTHTHHTHHTHAHTTHTHHTHHTHHTCTHNITPCSDPLTAGTLATPTLKSLIVLRRNGMRYSKTWWSACRVNFLKVRMTPTRMVLEMRSSMSGEEDKE